MLTCQRRIPWECGGFDMYKHFLTINSTQDKQQHVNSTVCTHITFYSSPWPHAMNMLFRYCLAITAIDRFWTQASCLTIRQVEIEPKAISTAVRSKHQAQKWGVTIPDSVPWRPVAPGKKSSRALTRHSNKVCESVRYRTRSATFAALTLSPENAPLVEAWQLSS